MEVGAVKQAFNNEVIHLKKNLNRARIHVIHKLTRKAKTFMDKKAPDALKEKLKRKAEAAVKEVLILKKIKPKELARFIITHSGKLQDHLNKPTVDMDKACARLLLHKSLEDKYEFMRSRFSEVPIKDLYMSRQERIQLKKEEKEKQAEKKKKKQRNSKTSISSEGDWNVEDIVTSKTDDVIEPAVNGDNDSEGDDNLVQSDEETGPRSDEDGDLNESSDDDADESMVQNDQVDEHSNIDNEDDVSMNGSVEDNDGIQSKDEGMFVKLKPEFKADMPQKPSAPSKPAKEDKRAKLPKLNKGKNKNLNEKLSTRKIKKSDSGNTSEANKIVDPFFITSTGENYMSLVEPRAPDEEKEVHKQGNRQMRRARMFGHAPKVRPRSHFEDGNNKNFKQNKGNYRGRNEEESSQNTFKNNRNNYDRNNRNDFEKKPPAFTKQSKQSFKTEAPNKVPEKLHPSWAAKKKISNILPFQGKKIVFNE